LLIKQNYKYVIDHVLSNLRKEEFSEEFRNLFKNPPEGLTPLHITYIAKSNLLDEDEQFKLFITAIKQSKSKEEF